MRITCPNCGAQYAVDPRMLPEEGRDVQCSSCGHTWFQLHPENETEEAEPPVEAALPRRTPDPEVMEILREEAERERQARAADAALVEAQPDLPIEPPPRRPPPEGAGLRQRPVFPVEPEVPEAEDDDRAQRTAPRRGVLPDIEEINSTLDSGVEHDGDPGPVARAHRRARERQGMRLGFGLAASFFALLAIVYIQGPRIGSAVPAFEPALAGYVGVVDRGRLWLDGALRAAVSDDLTEAGVGG